MTEESSGLQLNETPVCGRYSQTGVMSMMTPITARRRWPQEPPVPLWVRRAKTGGGPVGQSLARHPVLSEMPTFDKKSGDLRVVIETPKGSRNKYDYDPVSRPERRCVGESE